MRDAPDPASGRTGLATALRARLTATGVGVLIAGTLLGLALFLPWYAATAGPYEGEALSGWLAFERTDRVLVALGLLVVGSVAFVPSLPLAWARVALGAAAALVVVGELVAPPGESLALLRGGFVALLAAVLALGVGLIDLVPSVRAQIAAAARPLQRALTRQRGRRDAHRARLPSLRRISLPAERIGAPEGAEARAHGATLRVWTALGHAVPIAAIAIVGLLTAWPAFDRAAVDGDNLWALSIGSSSSPLPLLVGSTFEQLPYYRPLPYLTIWAQYRMGGIAPDPYFAVNVALYLVCGIALYLLVQALTGFRLLALASALLLVVDESIRTTILGIGSRTQSMACLFALLALTLAIRGPTRRPRAWTGVLFLVLLAAALSKEVGLAASLGVLVLAAFRGTPRRRELVLASVGAVAAYAALRFGLAGTTLGSFCDDMGYFDETTYVCYGEPTAGGVVLSGTDLLAQYAYNVAAAFLGTFVPTMFDANGALADPTVAEAPFYRGLALSLLLLAAVCLAAIARPRKTLPLVALIAGNAVLGFAIYRTRNLLPGVAAHYAAASVGFAVAGAWVARLLARTRPDGFARVLVGAGAAVLTVLALVQSADLREALRNENDEVGQRYRCDGPEAGGIYTPAVVEQSKDYYGVEDDCEGNESADGRERG